MVRHMVEALTRSAERRMATCLYRLSVAGVLCMLATASAGFGLFGGYRFLRETQGPVAAAGMISAGLAVLAVILWWVAMRRRPAVQSASEKPVAASIKTSDFAEQIAASGLSAQDQQILAMAMEAGRHLSMQQALGLALVAGVLAGRKVK